MNDTAIRNEFLEKAGINLNEYPSSFYETIKNIPLSSIEQSYCAYWRYCDGKKEEFHIKDVVGTNHQRYYGKSWIDAYFDLARGTNIIRLYNKNPEYYKEIRNPENTDLGLIKHDGKYYIFDKAGGGNNRLITMKILYLSKVAEGKTSSKELEDMFTFSANVRELPKDRDLPYIIIALAEDLGFSVTNSNGTIQVCKSILEPNVVVFQGNQSEIKTYFLSLFDTKVNSEDLVRQRLNKIRRTFGFSGPEYREKMEGLVPDFKE